MTVPKFNGLTISQSTRLLGGRGSVRDFIEKAARDIQRFRDAATDEARCDAIYDASLTMWHAATDWAYQLHEAARGRTFEDWKRQVLADCPAFGLLSDQAISVKHRLLGRPVGGLESTHTSTPTYISVSVGPIYQHGTRVIPFEDDKQMVHHWRVRGADVEITPTLEACYAYLQRYVDRVEPR